MKNIIKTTAYSAVALSSVAFSNVSAAIDPGKNKVSGWVKGNWDTDISSAINNFLTYILLFLGLIAMVLFLWAGFNILTAAWDEEKVKKGKTTMIQAAIWLFVIFFAWQLVDFIFSAAQSGTWAIQ